MVSRRSSEPTFEFGTKSRGIHQQRDRESVRLILSSARGRCRPHWEYRTAVRDQRLIGGRLLREKARLVQNSQKVPAMELPVPDLVSRCEPITASVRLALHPRCHKDFAGSWQHLAEDVAALIVHSEVFLVGKLEIVATV